MKNLQIPINKGRCPTAQERDEIRSMVKLECVPDEYFITPEDDLVSNLRFEDAQIRIVENIQLVVKGRYVDAALLVWPTEQWCMVFVRKDKPVIANIHWRLVFNCDIASLLCDAYL